MLRHCVLVDLVTYDKQSNSRRMTVASNRSCNHSFSLYVLQARA